MSRNITPNHHSFTEEDYELQNTRTGKLIFTKIRNRLCALLIQNDCLTAARVLSEAPGKIGAIYIGKVKNVVKNIDACFVEIADGEICFLPLKETAGAYLTNRVYDGRILEGDELLVQVTKEAQKTKQASVTAQISISNETFAFTLGRPGIGYSNKLSKATKERLKKIAVEQDFIQRLLPTENTLPIGMVFRTHAGMITDEQLISEFNNLSTELVNLLKTASYLACFSLIKEAPSDFETVFQQLVYPDEYSEIITDIDNLHEQLTAYVQKHFPYKNIRLYQDESFPLTKLYALETKLDTALSPRIWLKSGGYLIIEPTEALTVIDVNSGKYEAKKGNQESVFKVNCEAAEEIALQLRLRNLSGIIIVDFINMTSLESQEELLTLLRRLVNHDKQKTIVVDMTPLGLVEITRKKEHKPLHEQFKGV